MQLAQRPVSAAPRAQRAAAMRSGARLSVTCVAKPSSARAAGPSSAASQDAASSVSATTMLAASAALAPLLLQADPAMAVDGAYGILEGRTVALIHPGGY